MIANVIITYETLEEKERWTRYLLDGEKLRFVEFSWPRNSRKSVGVSMCKCGDFGGWFASRYDALTWRVFNFSRALRSRLRRPIENVALLETTSTSSTSNPRVHARPRHSLPIYDREGIVLSRLRSIDSDRELVDLLEGDYSIIRVEGIFSFFFCKEELIIARVWYFHIRPAKYFRFSCKLPREMPRCDSSVSRSS